MTAYPQASCGGHWENDNGLYFQYGLSNINSVQ